MNPAHPDATAKTGTHGLPTPERRLFLLLLVVTTVTLLTLIVAGVIVERPAHTPLVQVGQAAPDFTLPATTGGDVTLGGARGGSVLALLWIALLAGYARFLMREEGLT